MVASVKCGGDAAKGKGKMKSLMMTVVAALIGILLYKEKIELIGIAGIILVLSSIMLINVTAVGDGSSGC